MFLAATLLLGFGSRLSASDTDTDRKSLQGIKGVTVVIEGFNADVVSDGLTVEQVKTDVELRVRKAGIVVHTDGFPILHVDCNVMKHKAVPLYVYNCQVALHQGVTVIENHMSLLAATWSVAELGSIGQVDMSKTIRYEVADLVDMFLNAYLSANPK
jgi:hypothetical protein